MTSTKRTDMKPASWGSFSIPIFYKLMVSMMFVATIPLILLGFVSMGGPASIRESIGLENSIIIITLATLMVVIIGSYSLANSITKPIVRLSKIATGMSTGDLKNPEIELLCNDEIGELQTAFNRLVNTYKILDALARDDND